ncbi:MAG: cell division protein ZapE [Elusimicrobia bacterium]|nr:cell division protein ZapE [Elusimicrobiota bacterium]
MVEKWELQERADKANPKRHRLLLKAHRQDVLALIREFANLCGRPTAAQTPEGYNWSIDVRSLSASNRASLSAFLDSLSAAAPAPEPELSPESAPSSEPAPMPAEPQPAPVQEEPAAPPPASEPAPIEPIEAPPPEPAPAFTQESQEPAPEPAETTGPPAEEKAEAAVDFDRNFDSLLVGPYNRFAHAAATSVVDSPASLYNPLFLFGPPGVGKTHFLHAIAAGLSQSLGPDGIILTTGFKLSYILDSMRGGGLPDSREALEQRARALIIDDFHLMNITDSNKSELARLFAAALKKKCQIAAASLYPPKALAVLEQALGLSFARGWAVDLKIPSAAAQADVFKSFLQRRSLDVGVETAAKITELCKGDYAAVFRSLERLSAFKTVRAKFSAAGSEAEAAAMLFDAAKTPVPDAMKLESARSFSPPAAGPDAPGLALFFPQGRESAGAWCMARFFQAAGHYGFSAAYRPVLSRAYDASQGTPFEMGRACLQEAAKAAIVVGPAEDSPLFAKAAEFRHAVLHVLSAAGVRSAWIAHDEIAGSAPFLNAHLDLSLEAHD